MFKCALAILVVVACVPDSRGQRFRIDPREKGEQYTPERLAQSWYGWYLRRNANGDEWGPVAKALRSERAPIDVLADLLGGKEYYDYAGGTLPGFVLQLMNDVGHVNPSGRELSDVLRNLPGEDRRAIAFSFLDRYRDNWVPGRR